MAASIRRWAGLTAAALAACAAAPALACVGELPPDWPSILKPGGPTVFLGRVVQMKLEEPPRRQGPYEISEATAWIRPIEVVQGEFSGEARITGAVGVRSLGAEGPMYCGAWLGFSVGEYVLVVTRTDGSYQTVSAENLNEPLLNPFLEKHGGPRR